MSSTPAILARAALPIALFLAPVLSLAQDDDAGGAAKPEGAKTEGTKTEKLMSPDEKFVRETLKDYLHPSTIAFEEDGRCSLTFDFTKKSPDHAEIFHKKLGRKLTDRFRFSNGDEDWYARGIRVSNAGMALLNAWFQDDVEAEITYEQHVNFKNSHVVAVVFCTPKNKMLGTNMGTQVAFFSKTGRPGKRAGRIEPAIFNQEARIKLVVKEGKFEAHREGRKKIDANYKKGFESGRIGFVWGGSLSGTVMRLEVKGKLDYELMAKHLKKAFER